MQASDPVRARLLKAALDCFLADEYHHVTTRVIAEKADANVSMIRYYFGSKEGLYEEMIRDTMNPVLAAFESQDFSSPTGFGELLRLYYQTMSRYPAFPKLILKILALNQGPGKRFIQQLLERTRTRGLKKMDDMKSRAQIEVCVDPHVLRMSFVSLAMTPMLLKELFEEQMDREIDARFLDALADFNGRLLSIGLGSLQADPKTP